MSSKRNPNARDDWQTPEPILDRVRVLGPIGLDPASCDGNPTKARVFLTPERSGLGRPWTNSGLVYCNPPYKTIWYARAEMEARLGVEMVLNIMAKPGAGYFQALAQFASRVCFWKGRIQYIDPITGLPAVNGEGKPQLAGFDSAFLYFGSAVQRFHVAFADAGWIVNGGAS